MKKSDDIRRRTWRMLAKNLIVLVALAVAAAVGVMSWFTQNTTATADGISVQTQVEDGLEFYIMPPSADDQYAAINTRLAANAAWNEAHKNDEGFVAKRDAWHTSSDGEVLFDFSKEEFAFMENLFLCEVTGDGSTFNIPKLIQYNNVAYVDETQAFDTAVANDNYMSFDLYFRCETDQAYSVSLLSDSSFTPASEYETGQITGFSESADAENRKDAAIGAVRMSLLNMQGGVTREVLWIPGPYVYYDGLNDTLYTGLASSAYSNKGTVYYNGTGLALRTGEGTNTHSYYASNSSRYTISNGITAGKEYGTDKSVLTLSNTSGGYKYGHVRVNLWIEGEDAEARLAFVGGKYQMSLHFELTDSSNS